MEGTTGLGRRLKAHVTDPVHQADALQVAKTVFAAVVAWVVAVDVTGHQQAFLAPWSALLTVHATVYRTLTRGLQSVGAAVVGVLLAFAVGSVLGVTVGSLAVTLVLGFVIGSLPFFRDEGVAVATTALIVLTTGYSTSSGTLAERLVDTSIGIAVGILVNLVVFPPLNDRAAARQVDRIDDEAGELLRDMAAGLAEGCDAEEAEDWVARSRNLDEDIEHAWRAVDEASESTRLNLRSRLRGRAGKQATYGEVLRRLEQSVAETRSMARTLSISIATSDAWDPVFKDRWLVLLRRTAAAVIDANDDDLRAVRTDLDLLCRELSGHDLAALHWPVYGALLVNLRNIVEAMADVAAANPVTPATHRLP